MKERLNKTNFFLIIISTIIGMALGIFVKSNIPNIVPVTLDDLQKMNEEKHIVDNELEEIRNLIEDKEKHLKGQAPTAWDQGQQAQEAGGNQETVTQHHFGCGTQGAA